MKSNSRLSSLFSSPLLPSSSTSWTKAKYLCSISIDLFFQVEFTINHLRLHPYNGFPRHLHNVDS
ncbi:hypothetical protein THRCLA_20459 [Thraustotheca clavata]|uniref:Uncharacterized protein n=1 Tax=Thraustotheca clavata TaxID=74557 RepID=A0A1W0A7P8_9STRA|nr:hypothetical protein THRCLA_20459 [Thraustotheca clavata]